MKCVKQMRWQRTKQQNETHTQTRAHTTELAHLRTHSLALRSTRITNIHIEEQYNKDIEMYSSESERTYVCVCARCFVKYQKLMRVKEPAKHALFLFLLF